MQTNMTRERALETLRSLGGTITSKEAVDAGLEWRDLYALRDEGLLIELSRGVFRLEEAEPTPYLDFVAVYRRCPHGTICLNSALSFWDLTDEVPFEVHLAVPRGSWQPNISYPPTRVHVFSARTFDLGRSLVEVGSKEEVAIYSPERSVVDAMRLRRRVGSDVAYEALRRYLSRPGASPANLLRLARTLGTGGPMAEALEVLTG
jgi:predicted transcriptional regulator of viral defense system